MGNFQSRMGNVQDTMGNVQSRMGNGKVIGIPRRGSTVVGRNAGVFNLPSLENA
jgi:hypothetical protein